MPVICQQKGTYLLLVAAERLANLSQLGRCSVTGESLRLGHASKESNRVIPCQITQWLKRYPPPPDFDENLHIWSIWSEKKICQII